MAAHGQSATKRQNHQSNSDAERLRVCVCILYRISEQQQAATCVVWSETAPKRQAVNCCPVLAGRTDDYERPHRPLCIRECLG